MILTLDFFNSIYTPIPRHDFVINKIKLFNIRSMANAMINNSYNKIL